MSEEKNMYYVKLKESERMKDGNFRVYLDGEEKFIPDREFKTTKSVEGTQGIEVYRDITEARS